MISMSTHSWLRSVGYRLGQVREQLGFVTSLSEEDYKEVAYVLPTTAAFSLFRTMSPADQQHSLRVCRRLSARGCSDVDMLAAALLHDVGKAEGRVPFWTRPVIVLGKKLAPQLLTRLVAYPNTDVHPAFTDRVLVTEPWKRARPYETSTFRKRPASGVRVRERCRGRVPIIGAPIVCSIAYPIILLVTIIASKSGSTINKWNAPLTKWRLSLSYAWYHADIGADLALDAGLSERAVLYIRTHHRSDGPAAELHEVDEVS